MTADHIIYVTEGLLYLAFLVAAVLALRGIRRELKRIADRLDDPRERPD